MADPQRTLAIIKPDAVANKSAGQIIARIEASGLEIVGLKRIALDDRLARGFYAVHKQRPFFDSLVRFMTSGPVVMAVLEGEDAIARYRRLMGATNPAQAEPGTLRKDFATDIEKNTVHGSDSLENAKSEVSYFFPEVEVHTYAWKDKR